MRDGQAGLGCARLAVLRDLNAPRLDASANKRTLLGTPNREPQEYSRNRVGFYLPGYLYSTRFILYSWGSLFGVPIRTVLEEPEVADKWPVRRLIIRDVSFVPLGFVPLGLSP